MRTTKTHRDFQQIFMKTTRPTANKDLWSSRNRRCARTARASAPVGNDASWLTHSFARRAQTSLRDR
jgi:hypothetical protein